mmetsp:Transcript_80228/g.259827  ORF Transcript_80228/g.259827 Transcript_80228/m.259827 type:complete len:214 (+) Transcript_80228:928-1569(+)
MSQQWPTTLAVLLQAQARPVARASLAPRRNKLVASLSSLRLARGRANAGGAMRPPHHLRSARRRRLRPTQRRPHQGAFCIMMRRSSRRVFGGSAAQQAVLYLPSNRRCLPRPRAHHPHPRPPAPPRRPPPRARGSWAGPAAWAHGPAAAGCCAPAAVAAAPPAAFAAATCPGRSGRSRGHPSWAASCPPPGTTWRRGRGWRSPAAAASARPRP